MKTIKYMIAFGLLLPMLTSCGLTSFSDAKDNAESTVSELFGLIQEGEYVSALDYYSDSFFKTVSEEDWIGLLEHVNETLGDLESYELLDWNVEKKMGMVPRTYVQLLYKTQYSRYEAQEKIVLQRESRGSNYRIIGHHIKSPGFLKGF